MMMSRSSGDEGFTLVELLVSIVVMSIVAASILTVVVATQRSENRQGSLQEAMDDGRLSMNRIRTQLRAGRRVLPTSNAQQLYWWSDFNQDGVQQTDELITFCVAQIGTTTCETTSTTGRFALIRWTDAVGQSAAVPVAETLVSSDVFSGYVPDDATTPDDEITTTRTVTLTLALETEFEDAFPVTLEAEVRLRNVE